VDRLFWVDNDKRARFDEVFGPDGTWSLMLKRSPGFVRSDLQWGLDIEGQYRLRDFWLSHWDFESFRRMYAEELDELSRVWKAEGLFEREWWVGTYYVVDDDSGEAGSVPA
jgi:hypothetical protein